MKNPRTHVQAQRAHLFNFLLLLLVTAVTGARADAPIILAPGKGMVRLYSTWGSTNTFHRADGELRLFDTVGTSFSTTIVGLTADYGLANNLELNLDMPIGYFSLTSKERFPSRSLLQLMYLGIGATYQLSRERLITSISSMAKIPSGFHQGIYDDPNHPTFLSDGYFQWTTMFNVGFNYKQVWMKGGVGYNFRAEEPADEVPYNIQLGFSRVEGTGIYIGGHGVISTADVTQPLKPFYAGASGDDDALYISDGGSGRFSTIDRESYFAVDAGAYVEIASRFKLDGSYAVKLFGSNTLNLQMALLGVSYSF